MRHVRARSRRSASLYVRSALALGLVLGAGAAATDASWTDQELASGTFKTATFNTESSVDNGGSYTDHATTATAGTLAFTAVAPTPTSATPGQALYPGATMNTSFAIRAKAGSIAGIVTSITPSSIGSDAVLTSLQYRMYWDTAACNTAATTTSFAPSASGAWLQQTAAALSTAPTVPAAGIPLAVPTAGSAGTPVFFCVQLTVPTSANPPQNTAAGSTFTWTFATQNS
ncbi:hypothetical protein GCM10022286_21900 [Gryllotalpicola daejeonensis]|uniref:Ribosomally synthesized peptide with SipW-like signal peptide n=1 Tax=Gryllotalpicola daejeonensis TaxID=993087 RepID=A0ABP7ZL70_9MICO